MSPSEAAVEETFVNRDPQSALKLGQARGVALVAPALAGLPVAEYAANLVKKTVVGTGHAEKAQIAMMVKFLLPKSARRKSRRRRGRRARGRHHPRAAPSQPRLGEVEYGPRRYDRQAERRRRFASARISSSSMCMASAMSCIARRGRCRPCRLRDRRRRSPSRRRCARIRSGSLASPGGRARLVPPAADRCRASAPKSRSRC